MQLVAQFVKVPARGRVSASGHFSRVMAARMADFGPRPGRRAICSTSSLSGSECVAYRPFAYQPRADSLPFIAGRVRGVVTLTPGMPKRTVKVPA